MSSTKRSGVQNAENAYELPPDAVLFGCTPAMAMVRKRAAKVCEANIPVLLCGPAGSGKEMVARWVHSHSEYRDGQFVKVNCAAIPGSLLESELFGYEKGAFTGARVSKPGRVEQAHKGTLFLDEIGNLDLSLQGKLLHFAQDGRFSSLGHGVESSVETRLICSSNRNLEEEIEAQSFRADLFYRISVVQLTLPGLSERKEDIPALAEYLRTAFEKQFAMKSEPFAAEMLDYLQNLDWPGNVRELSNRIARYVLLGPDAAVTLGPPQQRSGAASSRIARKEAVPLKQIAKDAILEMERSVILEVLRNNQWNRRKAAQALKISYRTLIYKIRNTGLMYRAARDTPAGQEVSDRSDRKTVPPAD
ncbi:MAG TPA: sigma-54 dependent transcriptional regulator [Candidatus Acidoferrum sp.]|jgi:two-component system response regulator AtoC